jgi:hypothetical protein
MRWDGHEKKMFTEIPEEKTDWKTYVFIGLD